MGGARAISTVAVITGLLASPSVAAAAQPGQLDPSFAGGSLITSNTQLLGVTTRSDGSVVAAGTTGAAQVLEYDSSGNPLASFGGAGPAARGVAVQPDGKIVVVGGDPTTSSGMVVERFAGNSPDSSFGSGGVVTLFSGSSGVANAVAIQPDGKIVVAGSEVPGIGDSSCDPTSRVTVVRLNPDGSLDSSFGSGGTVVLDLGQFSQANAVALQPDGKIVVVGSQRPGCQITNGLIARLNSNGSLDGSFGGGGNSNLPCGQGVCFYYHPGGGAYSSYNAVALQNDGKIVVGGSDVRSNNDPGEPSCVTNDCPQAIVVRYTSGGAPDPSFGTGGAGGPGVAAVPSGSQTTTGNGTGAFGIGIGGGGDIIAAGDFQQGSGGEIALWAFTPSGSPDPQFGSGGASITPSDFRSHARALSITADGSLVVAGVTGSGGFVARYVGLGPPPPPGQSPPPPNPGVAPTVTTGPATLIAETSATVTGQVNPNGSSTTYHVDYGSTQALGSSTPSQTAGSGSTAAQVSAQLTGLTPATTYDYRLVATNAAGTTTGDLQSLTTASGSASPILTGGGAGSVGETSAVISALVNPNGLPTSYHIEYGTSSALGSSTPVSQVDAGTASVQVQVHLTGLHPNTTYYYRVVATNSAGTTDGSQASFTTAPLLRGGLRPLASSYRFSTVINHGLSVSQTCNQGCSVKASLLLPAATAHRLGLKTDIGDGSSSLGRAGTARLRIKLTKAAKRKLASLRKPLKLTLRVVATPAGGGQTVISSRKLTLHS